MNKIVIKSIKIENFAGIKSYVKDFENQEKIYAKNGAGKTSIVKALQFVLGQNVKDYIPTLENKELLGLKTIVKVKLDMNGIEYLICITRVDEIKNNIKTGNIYAYAIDNIDLSAKAYIQKLSDIFRTEQFDIITNIELLNTMQWQERRKFLFKICNVDEYLKELVNSKEFEGIKNELIKGQQPSDMIASVRKKKKLLNENLIKGSGAIEEKEREITELNKVDFKSVEEQIKRAETEIENLKSGIEKPQNIVDMEQKIISLEEKLQQTKIEEMNKRGELLKELNELQFKLGEIKIEGEKLKSEISSSEKFISSTDFDVKTSCQTCKQELPKEEITAVKKELKLNKKQHEDAIKNANSKLEKLRSDYETLKIEYEKKHEGFKNFTSSAQSNILENAIKTARLDLQQAKQVSPETLVETQINALRSQIKPLNEMLAKKSLLQLANARLEELRKSSLEIAEKIRELELKEQQIIKFIRMQSQKCEEIINKKFENAGVKFVLFETIYSDEELREKCELVYENKLYSNLSTGEKIRANLACAKILQEHYRVLCPILIDNAEVISGDIKAQNQLILMFVKSGCEIDGLVKIEEKEKV